MKSKQEEKNNMKKRALLASAMALALAVSPLGGMNVSATENGNASVSGESRASEYPEKVSFGTPYDLKLYENLDGCSFTYPINKNYGLVGTHLWIYRGDELVGEYSSVGDDSSPGSLTVEKGSSGSFHFEIPLNLSGMTSGDYYFKVRMEAQWPSCLAVSETVTSETITYTQPEQVLGTTVGYWDTEQEGLFHYKSVEGASGYEFRLYKLRADSGDWRNCILETPPEGWLTTGGHKSMYQVITADSPRDAGGEDRTLDFSNQILHNRFVNPTGSFCVTVRALSNNLSEIANGVEGEKSDVLEIAGGSDAGSDESGESVYSDDSDEADASTVEEAIEAAQPGEVISTQGIDTLTNEEMKLLREQGVTLEMSYIYGGVNYNIRIPAGAAMDNDIAYYGPLYLAQYYSVSGSNKTAAASGPSYTVKAGDTLGKIARANNMTLDELAAKNPQIKNVNLIVPGQAILIK